MPTAVNPIAEAEKLGAVFKQSAGLSYWSIGYYKHPDGFETAREAAADFLQSPYSDDARERLAAQSGMTAADKARAHRLGLVRNKLASAVRKLEDMTHEDMGDLTRSDAGMFIGATERLRGLLNKLNDEAK